jgi:hypothetical protein
MKFWLEGLSMYKVLLFICTSLVCVVGPSVTMSSTDFSFQNRVFFVIIWIWIGRNHFLNQYLSHSASNLTKYKSCSSSSFQQHQSHIPIPPKISAIILFNFQWRNHSLFKNFCTTSPNIMEPSLCTPPPPELSKETKNRIWSILVGWIS